MLRYANGLWKYQLLALLLPMPSPQLSAATTPLSRSILVALAGLPERPPESQPASRESQPGSAAADTTRILRFLSIARRTPSLRYLSGLWKYRLLARGARWLGRLLYSDMSCSVQRMWQPPGNRRQLRCVWGRLLPLQGAVHRAGAGVAAARQQAAAWIRRAARHRDVSSRSKQSPCFSAALQGSLVSVRRAAGSAACWRPGAVHRGDQHLHLRLAGQDLRAPGGSLVCNEGVPAGGRVSGQLWAPAFSVRAQGSYLFAGGSVYCQDPMMQEQQETPVHRCMPRIVLFTGNTMAGQCSA